jgi:hypothetical protein
VKGNEKEQKHFLAKMQRTAGRGEKNKDQGHVLAVFAA